MKQARNHTGMESNSHSLERSFSTATQYFLSIAEDQFLASDIPLRFGDRELERALNEGICIGAGGFGTIFSIPKPRHIPAVKSTVATKHITLERIMQQVGVTSSDQQDLQSIEHLCRLMIRNLSLCMKGMQNDPHILSIYDVCLTKETPGILVTMEHMERTVNQHMAHAFSELYGREWKQHLQAIRSNEKTTLDGTRHGDLFLGILSEVLEGVRTLHQYGMHVRDFKFSNIFVDGPLQSPTQVKIGDLDTLGILASEFKGEKEGMTTALDQRGKVIGTAQFMPDELLLGGQMSDINGIRWDTYAIGSNILAFLGEETFTGQGNIMTRLENRNRWRRRPLKSIISSALGYQYRDLAHVIWRSTEIDATLQYHTIEEIQEDIACLQQGKNLFAKDPTKYVRVWRRHKQTPNILGSRQGLSSKAKKNLAGIAIASVLGIGVADRALYETSLASYAHDIAENPTVEHLNAFEKKAVEVLLTDIREVHSKEFEKGSRNVFPYGQYYGEPFLYFDGTVLRSGDFLKALAFASQIPEHHDEAIALLAKYALEQRIVVQDEGVGDLNSPVGLVRFQAGTMIEKLITEPQILALEERVGIGYAKGMTAIATRVILGMFEEETGTFSWKKDPEYKKQTLPDGRTIAGTGIHFLYQASVIPFLCDLQGTEILEVALSGDIEKIIEMSTGSDSQIKAPVANLLREQGTILQADERFHTPLSMEEYLHILQTSAETQVQALSRSNENDNGMRTYAKGIIGTDGAQYRLLAYSDEPGANDLTGNTASEKTQRHAGILLGTIEARNNLATEGIQSAVLNHAVSGLFQEYMIQIGDIENLPPERWRVSIPSYEHTQPDTYTATLMLIAVQKMSEQEIERAGHNKKHLMDRMTRTTYENSAFRREDWFHQQLPFNLGLLGEQTGDRSTIRGNLIRGDTATLEAINALEKKAQ